MPAEYIYVLGIDGKPQMPTRRRRHVNKLLNTGKARIAEYVPFTIQLLYENNPVLQPIMMAEDPGRTNIGAALVGLKGQLYLQAVVETRNKEIRKLMTNAGLAAGHPEMGHGKQGSAGQSVLARC